MIITIDGLGGTGKSSQSKRLAKELGFTYFNTGSLYRYLTLKLIMDNVQFEDPAMLKAYLDQFEFKFTAPETGFYGIKLHADGMAIAATSFNVPLAIDVSDGRGCVLGMKKPVEGFDFGRLYVNVPKDTKAFTAAYFGDGREALKARFLDPQGAVAYEFEPVVDLRYAHIDNPESGLWTLQLDQPARHKVENHSLSLNGIPGWYFLSDKKYWR